MNANIMILDGGMGHELKLRGISDGTFLSGVLANENNCAANSNSDDASVVESIHLDYLAAGCDVITTNSFVAVPQRMIECGQAVDEDSSSKRASELITASVDRARSAIEKYEVEFEGKGQKRRMIAGCVPPLTECYFSNKVPSSIEDFLIPEYTVILTTLLKCKVDVLLAETLSTTREAIAILRSLSSIQQQRKMMNSSSHEKILIPPLWISFTVHDDKPTQLRSDESLLVACNTIIQEANALNALNNTVSLEAIGVNCSTTSAISVAVPILCKLVEGKDIKVSAYGNCFQTTTSEWITSLDEDERSNGVDDTSCTTPCMNKQTNDCAEDYDEEGYLLPDVYARYASEWVRSGATIIGGCCGSRPNHMRKVASLLKGEH